jgi:hypothetical protein
MRQNIPRAEAARGLRRKVRIPAANSAQATLSPA